MPARGFVIAAPASGSGKTVVTLALLRALRRRGVAVGSLKIGPDYIDTALHACASGRRAGNFDPWAMRPSTLDAELGRACDGAELVVAEGVMGLFDGAADGSGSTADAAARLGWPVILVVDVRGQGASAAALVEGFARHRADTRIAGIICNRIGSARHADLLGRALAGIRIPVLGMVPRTAALDLPERHLGLVQASEQPALESWLEAAATLAAEAIDLDALQALAAPSRAAGAAAAAAVPVPPPGERVAVAADAAFSFRYGHVLDGWAATGAVLSFFSPLADEAPCADADAVYLPGGYPELHAARLADNAAFLRGLRRAADSGATVFGECGGFMVLGRAITDKDGRRHAMAGLLPFETSFAAPRLHLGYRRLRLRADGFLGKAGAAYRGHEFHYSSLVGQDCATPLFDAADAAGGESAPAGCRDGTVMGAYMHLIDRAG
jgi:cobyrinic acid a,c-diamide synthase